MNTTQDKQ